VAYVAMSLMSVLTVGPAVGVVPGTVVAAVGTDVLVGNGAYVGSKVSVARATGEQAASPPRKPSAPTFSASLREIFWVMGYLQTANFKSHSFTARLTHGLCVSKLLILVLAEITI
jgi:hypothetical protein